MAGNGQAAQKFLARLLGSLVTRVIVLPLIGLIVVLALVAKIENYNPFAPHATINTTVVLGKLTKIEQAHITTRTYPVDVRITQSVGVIPQRRRRATGPGGLRVARPARLPARVPWPLPCQADDDGGCPR